MSARITQLPTIGSKHSTAKLNSMVHQKRPDKYSLSNSHAKPQKPTTDDKRLKDLLVKESVRKQQRDIIFNGVVEQYGTASKRHSITYDNSGEGVKSKSKNLM